MIHHLKYPFTAEQVAELQLGDTVYLDGQITMSAGLPTFKRLVEYVTESKALPLDLQNSALFHLGVNCKKIDGRDRVLYVNPTTSARFNPYMPTLIKSLNLKLVGGKGGLDADCVAAMKDVGCVYLAFLGGGAPVYSPAMVDSDPEIHWTDLVAHYRLTSIEVNWLGPLTVAIDSRGNSLYEMVADGLNDKFQDILESLKNN